MGAGLGGPGAVAVAVTVFVLLGSQYAAHAQHADRVPLGVLGRVLLLAASGLLLWRRRRPVAVVSGAALLTAVYFGAGYPYGPVFLPVVVACFAAVGAGHRRAAWTAVGLLWAAHVLVAQWAYRWLPPAGGGRGPLGEELVAALWAVVVVALAELAAARREQWVRARAERARAAERRADEERLRIARELHDVLAHSLSVINVQAGVGLALLDADPQQARTALTTIKAASKEALGEVRQVLDSLRAPGAAPRAPAPGLDRLPELVEQAAHAGLTVTVEGAPPPLAPHTDLAAFRIVQEALTNVVRHSGSRHARVRFEVTGGTLRLTVDDDGPATGADAGGSGNGLAGMRERAAALGGAIEAGARADGGYRVTAALPLRGAAAGTSAVGAEAGALTVLSSTPTPPVGPIESAPTSGTSASPTAPVPPVSASEAPAPQLPPSSAPPTPAPTKEEQ